nr:uncharacterized protein LOC124814948 [Hydra vulgaris]
MRGDNENVSVCLFCLYVVSVTKIWNGSAYNQNNCLDVVLCIKHWFVCFFICYSLQFSVSTFKGQQDITNFHVVNTYLNIVELSWDSFINATLYQVSGYDLKTYTVVNSTTNATTVKNLKMNTDYYFKVNVLELNNLTINKIMISSRLILVNAKTNMFSDKINFTATNATYNSILLNWYPFKAVILYKVEYSINGSVNETQNVMTSNSSIELTNLISNKTYRMKLFVVAINGIISEDQLQSNDLLYSTLKEKGAKELNL